MVEYSYSDLMELMRRLRDPKDGCPWDLKQTYRTIVPHTLEEVYEVIDTIEREDFEHLSEELGDLLFQVVFYAQIASEEERFTLDDVIDSLVKKLLSRHPHVFPDGTLSSRASVQVMDVTGVNQQWDAIKQQEKQSKAKPMHVLADVPLSQPGLLRAKKLQSKASKVGFDWPSIDGVISKVEEELAELKEALARGEKDLIEDELGDVLFALANVARHTKIDPEQAVRRTNQKFERRFSFVEQRVGESRYDWSDFQLDELDAFWDEAKAIEKRQ